jgi:murein DD-endopeptidase MepM/ murein hydrolase activator NlpD
MLALWLRLLTLAVTPSVTVVPASPRPGETVAIFVTVPADAAVAVVWRCRPLPVYFVNGRWRALLGVPADLPAGPHPLAVRVERAEGPQTFTVTVPVQARRFPSQRVRLSAAKRRLFAVPQVAAEKALWRAMLATATPEQLWQGAFLLPVRGRVTAPFGLRRIYVGLREPQGIHRGVDFAAPTGTPVRAANEGRVLLARPFTLEGTAVLLDHGQGVLSAYFHLAATRVREGETVYKGQIIGTVGSTGVATGPHLHWALYVHGTPVDPLQWTHPNWLNRLR